ncbi:MAG: deoxyribonuclease [Micrococcaceae bacterium]|nr:deoxyribonuclease [Micrococcaceae bacterium]
MVPSFRQLYQLLDDAIDPGTWWPADSDFEIGIGAILTQNTAWVNVAQAIAALHAHNVLNPAAIADIDPVELKILIRPAGFMNAKATYVKNYAAWFMAHHQAAETFSTHQLRSSLLAVKGIGPETADDMLLYIYDRPMFIWDTYAHRMLTAAGYDPPTGYEAMRRRLTATMQEADFTSAEQQRFHGLIVEAGKHATAVGGWEHYWQRLRK